MGHKLQKTGNEMMLTPDEARELLGVGRGTMYRLLKEGKIAHVRMGNASNSAIRIPRKAIDAFVGQSA